MADSNSESAAHDFMATTGTIFVFILRNVILKSSWKLIRPSNQKRTPGASIAGFYSATLLDSRRVVFIICPRFAAAKKEFNLPNHL
jgi:hypothetical protein